MKPMIQKDKKKNQHYSEAQEYVLPPPHSPSHQL